LESRRAALEILLAILGRRRPLEDALETDARPAALGPRDRAFARLLVATTLRRLGQIDRVLAEFLSRPLPARAAPARAIMRLAAAQLLVLGTPPHAAVATAVDLARATGQGAYKGLVNAVLRQVAREGPAMFAGQDAARLNTPDWLWRAWAAAFGEPAARAVAEAHLAEPPLDLSVQGDVDDWAGRLGGTVLPTGTVRLRHAGPVTDLPGYADGGWWVQDAAATLPARLLGPVGGRRVADLCAAPGGKTAQLAAAGARVAAVDQSGRRLARVAENLARLRLSADLVAADAADWSPDAAFDAVLLDAPCTATGTIRRHPDIPHLKRPSDPDGMAALQDRLLDNAVRLTAPGGVLVFATCSLQPEEGAERIERLLASGAPVARLPIPAEDLPDLAGAATPAGDLRTLPSHWPERGGLDGFFVARLRRH
jgi:16S rRNA (cytosine967-C5)-methyltransferase